METTLCFRDGAGHQVAAVLATPAEPSDRLAVLCHGFLSNKNSSTNKALTRRLVERGIATLRFDFFGQGESDGPFEAISVTTAHGQALAAVAWAADHGYRAIGLVGSSFGGLVALLAAADEPRLRCLGLKCPVPDFPELLRLEFGPEGMAKWEQTETIPDVTGGPGRLRLRYSFFEDCQRHDGYAAARKMTIPTLIVQGDRDELVPLHQARRLHTSLQGVARLEILQGADHGFSQAEHFHRMIALLSDWVTTHLGPTHPRTEPDARSTSAAGGPLS